LLLILLFVGIFLFGSDEKYQERPISTFVVADTISASLHVKRDSAGLPDGYEATGYSHQYARQRGAMLLK
jgi:hypothetical protein